MIEETGTIVEADEQFAWVEASSSDSCSHCSARQGCGTASLQKWFKRKPNRLRVQNNQHVQPGDRVVIGIPERALVTGSFMIYIIPLISLIAGAIIGVSINDMMGWGYRDGVSILLGVSSLIVSLLWLRKSFHQSANNSRFQPMILRRSL